MQPEQPIMAPVEAPIEKKKGGSSAIIMACLGILAVAGIGFGVYGFMKKPETKVETKVETVVSLTVAGNIVSQYSRSLIPHVSILDGMNNGTKLMLAYRSVPGYLINSYSDTIVSYYALDEEYYRLFGEHLAKESTNALGVSFSYMESGTGYGQFEIVGDAFGSNMALAIINKVKEASETDDGLTITVYHDNVGLCEYIGQDSASVPEGTTEGYCISKDKLDAAGVADFVENHENMVPTVDMTFKKNDDRYVLIGVTKNGAEETTE